MHAENMICNKCGEKVALIIIITIIFILWHLVDKHLIYLFI